MIDDSTLDYLGIRRQLTLAYFYLDRLRELIQKVSVNDFSSNSSKALLTLIERITDQLVESLESYNTFNNPTTTQFSLLIEHARIAVGLVEIIRYVEPTSVQIVPWALVAQLERLCKRFDWNIQIIVRPHFKFSYDKREVISEIRRIVKNHLDITPILDTQPRFMVFSFPRGERQNMLQQALWAHEISHALEEVLLLKEIPVTEENTLYKLQSDTLSAYLVKRFVPDIDEQQLYPLIRFWQRFLTDMDNVSDEFVVDDEIILRATQDVWEVIYYWASEIVCDLLALRLFGPSALFAFAATVETLMDLRAPKKSHPPSGLRMQLMVEEIHQLGFFDLSGDWTEQYGRYGETIGNELTRIRNLADKFGMETDQKSYNGNDEEEKIRCQIAWSVLSQALVSIQDYISIIDQDYFLPPTSLRDEILYLVELIEEGIPPNKPQIRDGEEPASLSSILNAGWFFWLDNCVQTHVDDSLHSSNQNLLSQYKKLNRLILKAIEASEIQLQYTERQRLFTDLR